MASHHSFFERFAGALALVSIALVVSGTRACQEDYAVGSQASGAGTGTPTVEATETDSGDDITTRTATPTVDPDGTVPPEETETPVPTATPAAATGGGAGLSDDSTLSGSDATDLMQELAMLGDQNKTSAGAREGNWLGDNFNGGGAASKDDVPSAWTDSDGDGFSDTIENAAGSLPMDALSVPDQMINTRLDERIRPLDSDFDGISNADELRGKTDPASLDTDGDGKPDGAEILSDGNPTVADTYPDRDMDGLSDNFERARGTNLYMVDTDNDGLRDDLELVVGSDPQKPDSDGDGVSDGKEFDLGSDPTVMEEQRN